MILIAGVSPKTKTLDSVPRICPECGLAQAYEKRIDHYLSIFFMPLLRVKKGEPFITCNRCERQVHGPDGASNARSRRHETTCSHCGRMLKDGFAYCPYCGRPKKPHN